MAEGLEEQNYIAAFKLFGYKEKSNKTADNEHRQKGRT